MGLLDNPLRSRERELPVYQRVHSPSKERYSDEYYYYSDEDTEVSSSGRSDRSSRNVSDSFPRGTLSLPKKRLNKSRWLSGLYPYRLPSRVTRYVLLIVVGTTALMIFTLVRASQVENRNLATGQHPVRPAAPPAWEKFPFLERYYGGIRTLVPLNESEPEYPVPNIPINPDTVHGEQDQGQNTAPSKRELPPSKAWASHVSSNKEEGVSECFIDASGKLRVPELRYYTGRPHGFPQNIGGSYELLNLPEDICFERYGRYGPYGFGYSTRKGGLGTGEHSENEGSELVWDSTSQFDFREVNWADVQQRCLQTNSKRFKPSPPATPVAFGYSNTVDKPSDQRRYAEEKSSDAAAEAEKQSGNTEFYMTEGQGDEKSTEDVAKVSRTAIVIRCYDEFLFREDDVANLRSIIMELGLGSGGRYDVHLLVQVKNDARHAIWADAEAYQARIEEAIPYEFRGLVTMWTETQMLALYQGMHDLWTTGPELPVHGVYRGLAMAMQHFAYMHPEYDYFWQWEMDVRYTGHYYDLVTKVEEWAKKQPRKGLWERNARFYIPETHGSWEDFSQMSRVQTEMGTVGADNVWGNVPNLNKDESQQQSKNDKTVWGPLRPNDENDWFEYKDDPMPPTPYENDRYQWGVGEEADLITLNPIFNPEGTTWGLRDDITGYNTSEGLPPRRASIITTSRMSRRLLMKMHRMTAFKKQFAFSEMWPATVSLQHGYKAVAVPHPLFVDRKWPVEYLANTLNAGHNGATGGSRTSVYGDREHNLRGLTWFYNSGFAPNLYQRWLGIRVNNDGGDEFEKTEDKSKVGQGGVGNMPGGEGRMCLPPMLLHPVKEVELAVEAPPDEDETVPESDPNA